MYTIQENVRIVISLLKLYKIRYIVISPGGTNIPISQAVQNDSFFHCYSIPDERSAMYFAIGLYLQTGEIIATSCTSAQATRNYIPGLTEAFYKHVPILAITTSKLERYQYQEYMQAPDQTSLPKDSVKRSYDLPPITDENTRVQCLNRAKEAILELTHGKLGPVQLNVRINDAMQSKFEEVELPSIKILRRYVAWNEWNDLDIENKKILIVIGEHLPFLEHQQKAIERFCENFNVAVYVNHLSNYHGKYSFNGNLLASCGKFEALTPDIFITIGGQTGDYSIFGSLLKCVDSEHWRVSEDGNVTNTYNKLTKIFECSEDFFFNRFTCKIKSNHSYFEKCENLINSLVYDVNLPFSNLYVAQQFHSIIPKNSYVDFAILNSLRCWSFFNIDNSIKAFSNVGAFGIDGNTSTLIGISMNTDELCFLVTGDLAFFYDMNALGIRHIKNNIRILLINNNCGAEFKIMTSTWKEQPSLNGFISAAGHNGTAKGWAENCGFEYYSVRTKGELSMVKKTFVDKNDKPIVLEIFTNGDEESLAINSLLKANQTKTSIAKLAKMTRQLLGDNTFETIKALIGK